MRKLIPWAVLVALLGAGLPAARAQQAPGDDQVASGDYYFKAGYYLKASEHYRFALMSDPSSPAKKLAFGHALFAVGNYSYASYALRRGVAQLDAQEPFRPDLARLFPSRRAFVQALRDLKRYVTYSPRDPAGLTVLAYVLFSEPGEEKRCADMLRYLQRLDPDDPFAAFFLGQLERRGTVPQAELPYADRVEEASEEEEPSARADVPPPQPLEEVPPAPASSAPLGEVLSEPERQGEQAGGEWPSPKPALAD